MGEKFEENNMKRSKQRRKSDTLSLLDYLGGMWASRNAFSIKINKENSLTFASRGTQQRNGIIELSRLFSCWRFLTF